MGVLARLFRRSRTTEEAQSAGAGVPEPTAPAEAATADEAKELAEAAPGAPVEHSTPAEHSAPESDDDGVAIPGQQSAGNAVDSEVQADRGART